ncbi:hypothetical protein BDZ90DRAFT_74732 [Jaminaea rosea]|uniref:F-box domain-containing protein n=1 Tax=Jaminaea rosea TaxID=1569628 RepID=A0A316UKE4_9BASI|nr:hypothetical protein BDZ90DRAFT_74732 [Jaminaea rosea]PWN25404.1 hypothetical protein BDZ90DRAFT_74732 [Jaminaea rosea]
MINKHRRRSSSPVLVARSIKQAKGDTNSATRFWHLPEELRSSILQLACSAPSPSSSPYHQHSAAASTPSRPTNLPSAASHTSWHTNLEVGTVAKLALVSKHFNASLTPLLYTHVKLDTPSLLFGFYAALRLRPDRGELVKSLHIGPRGKMDETYWPLPFTWVDEETEEELDDDVLTIATSLPQRLLPECCFPGRAFPCDLRKIRDCQTCSVARALQAAIEAINVDRDRHFCDLQGTALDIAEWTIRIFQLQEALDLYLIEMKRLDETRGYKLRYWDFESPKPRLPSKCRAGVCGHYPRLEVEKQPIKTTPAPVKSKKPKSCEEEDQMRSEAWNTGHHTEMPTLPPIETATTISKDGVLDLTLVQLDRPLRRSGDIGDHFDHPLFYARAGMKKLAMNDDQPGVISDHDSSYYEEFYPESIFYEYFCRICRDYHEYEPPEQAE